MPFLKRYCVSVNGSRPEARIKLLATGKDRRSTAFPQQWKSALAIVKAHDMPPEDADKQPSDEDADVVDWSGTIKFLSTKDPGRVVIRRLTKVEYWQHAADLFGVTRGRGGVCPRRSFGAGYLNNRCRRSSRNSIRIANEVLTRFWPRRTRRRRSAKKQLFGDRPIGSDPSPPPARRRENGRDFAGRNAYRRPQIGSGAGFLVRVFSIWRRKTNSTTRRRLPFDAQAVLVSSAVPLHPPGRELEAGQTIGARSMTTNWLASSYLLWATIPRELSALADNGTLHEPCRSSERRYNGLLARSQVPRHCSMASVAWLGLNRLRAEPSTPEFPAILPPRCVAAMYDRRGLFFDSIVRETVKRGRFVDSDYKPSHGTSWRALYVSRNVTRTGRCAKSTGGPIARHPRYARYPGDDLLPESHQPRETRRVGASNKCSANKRAASAANVRGLWKIKTSKRSKT